MSDLVGNPEDRFSRVEAQIISGSCLLVPFSNLKPKLYDLDSGRNFAPDSTASAS